MVPKKLCSIGILDININLVLRKKQAEKYNFNIDRYNSVEDLESLFFPNEDENNNNKINWEKNETDQEKIDYFNYLSLSSDDNLINTLLFINRAYKTKTFLEFIILNKMEFSQSTNFVRKILQNVFDKNYFFLIENKIMDIPSKITFVIKILDDNTDEIISKKSFELFEINEIDSKQIMIKMDILNSDKSDIKYNNILNLENINYNFENTNYFLMDLGSIKELKLPDNKNISYFIYELIKKCPNIKIILIVDDNLNSIEQNDLLLNKQLIDLSDIIFGFQSHLNNFFKLYNSTIQNDANESKYISKYNSYYNSNYNSYNMLNENDKVIANKKARKNDLIIDDKNKCRKTIPRVTVIYEEFKYVTIYVQKDIQMSIDYKETFITTLDNINENKNEYLHSNSNKFLHISIGGFLSRMIYNKSLRVCFCAGNLLIKKTIPYFMKNIDQIKNINQFNILVPSMKKNNKIKSLEKIRKKYEDLLSKENKFILDCTNVIKCQKKEYNSLLDKNCVNYLLKQQNIKHFKEVGFINKNGMILKDPDTTRKKQNLFFKIHKPLMLTETNFYKYKFLKNNQTNYNSINCFNYNNKLTKKNIPVFKPIFDSLPSNRIHKNNNFANKKGTAISLPKMFRTCNNFSKGMSKKLIYKSEAKQRKGIKNKNNEKNNSFIDRNKSFNSPNIFNYQKYLYQVKKIHLQKVII
jgi:hypothetical protein